MFDEVEELLSPKRDVDVGGFGRGSSFESLMRVDKVLDDAPQIEEVSCTVGALEMAFGFDLVFDVLVVALNRIVVVLEAVLFVPDRDAKDELCRAIKELGPSCAVILEFVAHERDDASRVTRLVPFAQISRPDLLGACCFDLAHERDTLGERSLDDKAMREHIFGDFVDSIEVVA
jgi:hypothetical protein